MDEREKYLIPETVLVEISMNSVIATSFSDGGEGIDKSNDFNFSNGWI